MKKVALTGGIASGKSLAAKRFAELGVDIIDSDVIAREIVEPGEPALAEIVARFGREVLQADGRLDRTALRHRVFADPVARRELEAITHPRIRARMRELSEAASGPYHLHVIPLLAESGRAAEFDRVIVVDCDPALQKARVQQRDGANETEAEAILAAQASRAERLAIADDVLVNDGSPAALLAAVDALHQHYLARWASRST
jgi:dephospho-CoA kinase